MSATDPHGDAGGQITRLLASVRDGDRQAIDAVFSLVYAELRTAARLSTVAADYGTRPRAVARPARIIA